MKINVMNNNITTNKINNQNVNISPTKLLIIVSFFCGIMYLLLLCIAPPHFGSNDDMSFLCLYSGIQTGVPSNITIFTSIIWSTLFSSLYSIAPVVPWYPLLHIVLIFLSILTISYTMSVLLHNNGSSIITIFCCSGSLFFVLYGYHSSNIQFTTTPALCCAGAICCIFILLSLNPTGIIHRYSMLMLTVLSFFSITPRLGISKLSNVSYIITISLVCCLDYNICSPLLLTLFHHITSKIKSNRRTLISIIIVLLFINIINCFANLYYFSSEEHQIWRQANSIRAKYNDYPHNSYVDDISVYNDNNWSESYYNLANKWYALDEKANPDVFSKVVSSITIHPYNIVKKVIITIKGCRPRALILLFVIDIIFILSLLSYRCNIIDRIIVLTPLAIIHIALLYFAIQGRMTDTALSSLLFVFIPMSMLSIQYNIKQFNPHNNIIKTIIILCVFSSLISVRSLYLQTIRTTKVEAEQSSEWSRLLDYASDNPSHFFIYDNSFRIPTNINSFYIDTYSLKKSGNVAWWGSLSDDLIWKSQLKNNGYNAFNTKNLFDENVLFASVNELDRDLINYLYEEYGNRFTYYEVYDNDLFKLYKLSLSE